MLVTVLLNLYKEEILALGGTQDDINKYSVQSLMSQVKDQFKDILRDKQANKCGNVVFPSSMTSTEAFALLNESNDKAEEMKYAAMALRTEILAMSSSNIPSPTLVHTLKENAPNIPHLTVVLFFRTLIDGMQPGVNNPVTCGTKPRPRPGPDQQQFIFMMLGECPHQSMRSTVVAPFT